MRQLCTVQKILKIEEHPNADKLEIARVLGWKCIVRKGDFKEGELIIYAEIDSVFPPEQEYEYLKDRKYRVRTIRLRGEISQGLVLSLDILKGKKFENDTRENPDYEWTVGTNVTDLLKVKKFEPYVPLNLRGKVKGKFPCFLPKTDETRVQVLQGLLDKYKGTKFYVSEKLDGTSVTYYMKDGVFGVCSRNLELQKDTTTWHENKQKTSENIYWKIAREEKIEEKLREHKLDNIMLQGEIIGEGIQKNPLKLKGHKVYFFNIFNIETGKYGGYKALQELIFKLKLGIVPFLEENYLLENDIQALVSKATVKSVLNKEVWAEGIVLRPMEEIEDKEFINLLNYNRVSFKAINPEFLLESE